MKALSLLVLLLLVPSAAMIAAERSAVRNISPAPMVAASRALREYVSEHADRRKDLSGELEIVSLTEELIVVQWGKIHEKDLKSRDVVLAEVERLDKRIDQLLLRVSGRDEKMDPEKLKLLKVAVDDAIRDFRLQVRTAFFRSRSPKEAK